MQHDRWGLPGVGLTLNDKFTSGLENLARGDQRYVESVGERRVAVEVLPRSQILLTHGRHDIPL
jgi:hypothetical protein